MVDGDELVARTKEMITTHKALIKNAESILKTLCSNLSDEYKVEGRKYKIKYILGGSIDEQMYDNVYNNYQPLFYNRKARALIKDYWELEKAVDKVYTISWVYQMGGPVDIREVEPWRSLKREFDTKLQKYFKEPYMDIVEMNDIGQFFKVATQFSAIRRDLTVDLPMFAENGGETRQLF